jgi:hypothetical protein
MMTLLAGLDLGQVGDPTALSVLEQTHDTERGSAMYHCHHLQRFQLGTEYTEVCSRVAALFNSGPYAVHDIILVVDGSGVGRPVVEMLRRYNMPVSLRPMVITGGYQWSKTVCVRPTTLLPGHLARTSDKPRPTPWRLPAGIAATQGTA